MGSEMCIRDSAFCVYNAARRKEAGLPFVAEAAMAKLKASRVAELSACKWIEWLGGVGFVKEFLRDCKIGVSASNIRPPATPSFFICQQESSIRT